MVRSAIPKGQQIFICILLLLLWFHHVNAQVSCPANFSLCYSKTPSELTAGQPAGGTYSGTGVSNGFFDPSAAGIGIHTVTHTVPNVGTCSFQITVYQAGHIGCVMEWPEVCTGMKPGNYGECVVSPGFTATYTGPGYVDNVFYPTIAGVGEHTYTITATDASGCLVEFENKIGVYDGAPPVINIPDVTVPSATSPSFALTGGVDITHYRGVGVSGDPAMGNQYIFSPSVAGNGVFTINVFSVFPDDDWIQKACYSEGTFKIQVGAMPVTLANFSATAEERDVILAWRTAMEKDFDRFEIERSADPKKGFIKIHQQQGGSSDGRYNFRDSEAEAGVANYYRLKMIDSDGTFTYSKIAWALPESGNELKIYPNPVKGQLVIDSPVTVTEMALINGAGIVVVSQKTNTKKQLIELPSLPAGIYLLELKRENAKSMFSKVMVR
jgi:hypothetical protein